MISAKRLAANRQNAQRSTGPRTAEGRLASRANSLKHGLTGQGEVLTPSLARAAEEQEKEFAASTQPRNALERALVRRIAVANARMLSSEREEGVSRQARRRQAAERWERRMIRAVEAAISVFEQDPSAAVQELESTSIGCRWLADLWRQLEDALDAPGGWTEAQFEQALAMFAAVEERERCTMLKICALALREEKDLDEADRVLGLDTADFEPPKRTAAYAEVLPDHATARTWLGEACQDQADRLEARGAQIENECERPDLDERMVLAELDASPQGMRKARYESMNEMSFHRGLRELRSLRKAGAEALGFLVEDPPQPRAQNEPTEEDVILEPETDYASASDRSEPAPEVVLEPFVAHGGVPAPTMSGLPPALALVPASMPAALSA